MKLRPGTALPRTFGIALLSALVFSSCQANTDEAAPRQPAGAALPTQTVSPIDSDYAGLTLPNASFANAVIQDANFMGATLVRADFSFARLVGANFEGADLRRTIFQAADLTAVSFRHANLSHADLSQAILPGADLTGARLDGVDFSSSTGVTDEMLMMALDVSAQELVMALHAHRILLEDDVNIAIALNPVCDSRDGVSAAATYRRGEGFHPISLLGDPIGYGHSLDKIRWSPVATRYAQLVACAKDLEPAVLKNCGDYGAAGHPVFLAQEKWRFSVYEARHARLIAEKEFLGPQPVGGCPSSVRADQGYITGGAPQFSHLTEFLAPFVGDSPKA